MKSHRLEYHRLISRYFCVAKIFSLSSSWPNANQINQQFTHWLISHSFANLQLLDEPNQLPKHSYGACVYLHVPEPPVPVQHCASGPFETECPGQYSGQLRSIANGFASISVSFPVQNKRKKKNWWGGDWNTYKRSRELSTGPRGECVIIFCFPCI